MAVDNSRTGDYIRENYGTDKRIQYKLLENNAGISENTNEAIKMATGEFIMFSDHDDTLAPNALFEIVKEMNEHPGTDVVYTDEDKVTMDGKRYFHPHFKPDFNLDMLRCNNYICHIFVVKREIQGRQECFARNLMVPRILILFSAAVKKRKISQTCGKDFISLAESSCIYRRESRKQDVRI